jgi:hypothetical protein
MYLTSGKAQEEDAMACLEALQPVESFGADICSQRTSFADQVCSRHFVYMRDASCGCYEF